MNELDLYDVDNLSRVLVCPSCGASKYDQGICRYCRTENVAYTRELEKLRELIKAYNYFKLTPNLIKLYALKDQLTLKELNDFINSHHLKEAISENTDRITSKLLRDEALTSSLDELARALFIYDLAPTFPSDYVIKKALLNQKLVSLDLFGEVIRKEVSQAMRQLGVGLPNYKPTCELKESSLQGLAIGLDKIVLNFHLVADLYNGNAECLHTIFHELTHIKQKLKLTTKVIDEETVRYCMEKVIRVVASKNQVDFYNLEYERLATEIDANLEGFTYFRRYLKAIGLIPNEDLQREIAEVTAKFASKREGVIIDTSHYAFISKDEATLEELFLECINISPELLKSFPILQALYINDEGIIREKTEEELEATLERMEDAASRAYLIKQILKTTQSFGK